MAKKKTSKKSTKNPKKKDSNLKILEKKKETPKKDILFDILEERDFVTDLIADKQLIFRQMALVLRDCKLVEKSIPDKKNKNSSGFDGISYATQTVASLIDSVHESMKKHGVFMTKRLIEIIEQFDWKTPKKAYGKIVTVENKVQYTKWTRYVVKWEFEFFTIDSSSIKTESIGIGIDYGDKGMNKSMSYALKYALIHTFLIPSKETIDQEQYSGDYESGIDINNFKDKNKKQVDSQKSKEPEKEKSDQQVGNLIYTELKGLNPNIDTNIYMVIHAQVKDKRKLYDEIKGDKPTFESYFRKNLDIDISKFIKTTVENKKKIETKEEKEIKEENQMLKEIKDDFSNNNTETKKETIKEDKPFVLSQEEYAQLEKEFKEKQNQGLFNSWSFQEYLENHINMKKEEMNKND
jgi:hypothetical protein